VGGKPLPLPVWDRQAGKLVQEFMDDHPATYDSRPRRSLTQWLESRRLYDWLIAAYQNSRWSGREIEPFISKHHIDMSEFKPVPYRAKDHEVFWIRGSKDRVNRVFVLPGTGAVVHRTAAETFHCEGRNCG
jgi:hypothetical protein